MSLDVAVTYACQAESSPGRAPDRLKASREPAWRTGTPVRFPSRMSRVRIPSPAPVPYFTLTTEVVTHNLRL